MNRETALANKLDQTTEALLWRGVIAMTIQDWLSKPLHAKLEAERYLFKNSADLSLVCQLAGISIGQLRTRLNMVRGRTLLDLLPFAA
jgi:AraC-like DNA-binding protein